MNRLVSIRQISLLQRMRLQWNAFCFDCFWTPTSSTVSQWSRASRSAANANYVWTQSLLHHFYTYHIMTAR